jgi:hypothetical protein
MHYKVQIEATTQYFGKRFFYKQVFDFHRPSKIFMPHIWESKSLRVIPNIYRSGLEKSRIRQKAWVPQSMENCRRSLVGIRGAASCGLSEPAQQQGRATALRIQAHSCRGDPDRGDQAGARQHPELDS